MGIMHKVIQDVEFKLRAAKCSYIIRMDDGTEYASGDLILAPAAGDRRQRVRKYPVGHVAKMYRDRLVDLQIGVPVLFERSDYPGVEAEHFRNVLQSAMCNRCGAGNYAIHMDSDTGLVEAVRLR